MNRRTLLLTFVVLALAAGTSWLSRQSGKETKQAEAASSAPDYFITDFSATELDAQGKRLQQLDGTHLAHFADQETVVHQPHVRVYSTEEGEWQAVARLGRARDQSDEVLLSGAVRLFRTGPPANEILTESLQLHPRRRYAQTADPVTILDAAGRVDAVGMQADLNQKRVTLLSRVRGTYDAP